jgi:hypothetical protein
LGRFGCAVKPGQALRGDESEVAIQVRLATRIHQMVDASRCDP